MSSIRFGVCSAAIFAAASVISTSAQAVPVSCPGTVATTDREFTLDTAPASTCIAFGPGNIDDAAILAAVPSVVLLDKSDDANAYAGTLNELTATVGSLIAGLSGSFSFTAPAGFFNFVIAFKSGGGTLDPDWAAFLLPFGVTSGSWTISGQQALSHVSLYGQACPTDPCRDPNEEPNPVPLPGALALFLGGAGLLGFLGTRRRRTVKPA